LLARRVAIHRFAVTVKPFGVKAGLASTYTPGLFLDALRGAGWTPGVVPETVIYSYARFELYLTTQSDAYTPNHMLGTGPGRFFLVNDTDGRVGINCLGTGPSATAAQLELQAELGVRSVVLIGTAGGLVRNQSPGDVVLPTSAVRADGTSDHYAPPEKAACPDPQLFGRFSDFLEAAGIVAAKAPCWTTAGVFRTTAAELSYYGEQGVRAVEEEVAALYVVGSARDVQTAACLVLDGVPTDDGSWRLDLASAQQQLQRLFTATIEFASTL
jgi:uridine phosphorylase